MSKLTVFGLLALVAVNVIQAEDTAHEFEKRKSEIIAEIDERLQKLQEHKSCVSASADADALKKCRASMKEWRHGEKAERLEKRKGRLEEKMKRLDTKSEP